MIRTAAVLLLLASCVPAFAAEGESADPWEPLRLLEGRWEGQGTGFGQTSIVTHEWDFVLDDNFFRLQTSSTSGDEVHHDVGYVSWSESERKLRFRQFLSEGFVNTFVVRKAELPAVGLDFEPDGTEGMPDFAVRMTFRFLDNENYEAILYMGPKNTDLKPCQTMQMHRVD